MILFNSVNNKLSNDHLTAKIGYREAQVLDLLIQNSPNVVKKSDIIQYAWGNQYIGETSLAKSISALRHALLKLGTKESPIVTVPKVGYRLVVDYIDYETPESKQAQNQKKIVCSLSNPVLRATAENESIVTLYHYRTAICYLTTLTLLFAAFILALSKSYGWKWEEGESRHSLTIEKIGKIEVISAQNTPLTPSIHQLLSQHQCYCVVYLEQNDQYSELSWMDRNSRRSINIFYSKGQLNYVSEYIADFMQEN
ncbi:transcriptional regulator [Vibrio pectenicida]|uniref:Transcriptional regulator n=1 Tax=Vibrio pectenicida TaxID=62763 RepID=A0A7Y3ZXV2_9VIBR|nr:winged helix-turn-helix domain-containing protein [Vibrio pectenicida]NOH71126.1 transcriptional regulator [Vibrio pectenicida]